MSIPARIMMIADIFEALSAHDRPYKVRKKLSECINIMAQMSREQHIDRDLFELFLTSGVYRDYAETFLPPEQIDEVDIPSYLAETGGPASSSGRLLPASERSRSSSIVTAEPPDLAEDTDAETECLVNSDVE